MSRLLLITLFVFSVSVWQAEGQGSQVGRLFFIHYGDLWSWNVGESEPSRHTTGGYRMDPTISPDGTYLAFRIIYPEAWASYGYEVSEIMLWDLESDILWPITTNANVLTDPENAASRSEPTWSPDGTQLAWTEWNFPYIAIMIYDLETRETRMHSDEVSFGYADGSEYQPQRVGWGRYISKQVFTYLEDSVGTLLSIYDDEGERCSYQLDIQEGAGFSIDDEVPLLRGGARWVQYDGEWWIGLQYEDQPYRLMHPDTGEQWEASETPALQLLDSEANTAAEEQRAALTENSEAVLPERALWDVSPDGEYLASQTLWTDEAQVIIWHDGEVVLEIITPGDPETDFYITSGLAWSYETWQLSSDAQITPVEPFLDNRTGDCD